MEKTRFFSKNLSFSQKKIFSPKWPFFLKLADHQPIWDFFCNFGKKSKFLRKWENFPITFPSILENRVSKFEKIMAFFLTFFQNNGIIDKFDKNAHFVIFHHYFDWKSGQFWEEYIFPKFRFFQNEPFSQNEQIMHWNDKMAHFDIFDKLKKYQIVSFF